MTFRFLLLAAAGLTFRAAAATPPLPDQKALRTALTRYLAERGQLCIGKYDWPITVAAQDAGSTRDAVQMPALEQAGLVQATPGEDGKVVYSLSESGRKYYWPRTIERRDGEPGELQVHDLCAGQLALAQVVRWTAPAQVGAYYESTVSYTYSMTPAEWTSDARLVRVFPMIERVIAGQGTAQLTQRVRFSGGRWEAVPRSE